MRVNQGLDWLVRNSSYHRLDAVPERFGRIEDDHAAISDEKRGLPHVVGNNENAAANFFNRLSKLWIQGEEVRSH
jgi:hypothetical protein